MVMSSCLPKLKLFRAKIKQDDSSKKCLKNVFILKTSFKTGENGQTIPDRGGKTSDTWWLFIFIWWIDPTRLGIYVGRYQEQPVIEFVCLLGPALVRRMDTGTGEKREKCSEVLMRHRPRVREHVSSAESRDVRRVIASVCPVPRSMLHYYNTTQCNTPPTHITCPAHV